MPVGATYTINGYAGEVISFNGNLATDTCPTCHIVHAFPEELRRRATFYNSTDYPKQHITIYCPNGHAWSYVGGGSEAARLRAQLAAAERRIADKQLALDWATDGRNRAKAEAAHERARANGYKGVVVKTAKRLRAGVCPHCNRSGFSEDRLVRHVNAKHPEAQP